MTRHEYGADNSSEAAANDGIDNGTAPAAIPGAGGAPVAWFGVDASGIPPDILTCFEFSSACSRFAMLLGKTGKATRGNFRCREH